MGGTTTSLISHILVKGIIMSAVTESAMSRGLSIILSSLMMILGSGQKICSQVYSYDSSRFGRETSPQNKLRGYYGLPYNDREAIKEYDLYGVKARKMLKMQLKKY